MARKIKWHRIAGNISELEFANNNIAVASCSNKQICVAHHKEKLYAFAYKCPHASGLLANADIDPLGNLVCPLHRYKYSMENGRNVSGEGYYLKTYPIETRDDGIYVGMEEPGLFGF